MEISYATKGESENDRKPRMGEPETDVKNNNDKRRKKLAAEGGMQIARPR